MQLSSISLAISRLLPGAGGVLPPATDPLFDYVSLLLNTTSTNGAQNNTFLDSSTNNFSITRNGNTTQGTFSPFSQTGWSNFFGGTNADYIAPPTSTSLSMTGDFTIEAWVIVPPGTTQTAFSSIYGGAGSAIILYSSFSGFVNTFGFWGSSPSFQINTGIASNDGVWHHVAAVRSGSTITVYVDGTSRGTATTSATIDLGSASAGRIGAAPNGATDNPFRGYISNLRLVKGTAVYTANFTPPTTPLTNITNTSLLTCQSNRFIDNSSNAFAITRNGDVSVQAFSPFNPTAAWSAGTNGGSGYFDGTGDYLSVPTNAAFGFGSGNFTVEFWIFPNSVSGIQVLTDFRTTDPQLAPYIALNGTSLILNVNGVDRITGTSAIQNNVWQHVACVKNGSSTNLYVNGVVVGSTYTDTNTYVSTAPVTIGSFFGGSSVFYLGFLSNARIVKGTAVYTAAFTPPTAPLTAITNTSLLCNFTNAGIFDSASGNDLETVGNAQVSTTVAKWGTTSMGFFSGSLPIPDRPTLRFGTAPFTIEAWINSAFSASQVLASKGGIGTGWQINFAITTGIVSFNFDASTLTASSGITQNTWAHVAIVREGTGTNQTKIYINGVNVATGTVPTNFNHTDPLRIGKNTSGSGVYNDYIDDLRITNGIARYTSNFTAPTTAFPLN
jgi:hypothetical protein